MSEDTTGKSRDRTDWARIDAMTEEEIEENARSDPDSLLLEDCDMSTLEVMLPTPKEAISLRVTSEVLEFFRSRGPGYQTRMNAVLEAYVKVQRGGPERTP